MTPETVETYGAFVPAGRFLVEPTASGPLDGMTFAAKDLIDVRGHVTTAGNPTWGEESGDADAHAPVVAELLGSGATLIGKTVLDELAFGVAGINAHHGTPANPAAPGHLAGGSSCGSAAAVAGGLCDFALGTDTGGSVRIPASYCGLFGIRPTHGSVDTNGVVPLARSIDTVGWLTRDVATFATVGDVLLPTPDGDLPAISRVLLARDAIATLEPAARAAFDTALLRLPAKLDSAEEIDLAGPAGDLATLQTSYRAVQGREASMLWQDWIEAHPGALGPMATERFRVAAETPDAAVDEGQAMFDAYSSWLERTLTAGTVICLPTTPGTAPRTDDDPATLAAQRLATLELSTAASAARTAQVSLPLMRVDGLPMGVSFIGAPGSDRSLLALAIDMAGSPTSDQEDDRER